MTLPDTLPARLLGLCDRHPDAVALREKTLGVWRELTWRDYATAVAAVARALADGGVGPGDAVGILSDNRTEWVFADLATQALGARAVGIYQTNPPDDVAYVLVHSEIKVLICEDQEQVDKAVEVAAHTPTVGTVVVLEPRGTRRYDDPRLVSWADFVGEGDLDWLRARLAERDPAEPSMVVYTSGTTGQPKGALISSANVVASADALVPELGVTARDTLLSYLPLCHVAEKIFTLFLPLSTGAVVHFGESIDTVPGDLREVSPTVFLGVPRIWEKVHANVTLKLGDSSRLKAWLYRRALVWGGRGRLGRLLADLLVFRALRERIGMKNCWLPVSGAAPISVDLLRWFHAIGVPVSEAYGMTECGGASHVNPPGDIRLGTVGRAIPGTECALAEDGEVLMRGAHVFAGYWGNPEATAEAIDADGWLHTGDLGAIEDGYLSIVGRKKDILITAGGKNLSPEKLENALKTSPYIKEAVALGDGRKFVSALIQVEAAATGDWAGRRDIPYTDFEDLTGRPEIVELIAGEVRKANDRLARVEHIRGFALLRKELHQDDGELTATQKVRRAAVRERHAGLIAGIYGGAA